MFTHVLIIDKRKELPTKYKRAIADENTTVIIAATLKDAINKVQSIEPDLILISDSIDDDLGRFCERIRTLTFNIRPVIIALSKSADTNDRIRILESGADDFLSEPVNIEEFKTRIRAHLRRDLESNLDSLTLLPNKKTVYKMLKRLLNSDTKQSVLLIGIENFNSYKSIYSDVAGDKLIQTLIAITKSALNSNDFIGQLDENNFIIITNPISAEKMAAFLTFAFDTVAPKFYSEHDAKRGYTLLKGDRSAEMRVDFVSILIGCILDNYDLITSVETLLEKLYSLKNIAKIPNGSNYAIDRVMLTGENSIQSPKHNRAIFIQEEDEALSLLLHTTLELQGYTTTSSIDINCNEPPEIIIMDTADDLSGLKYCKALKNNKNFVNTKIIVTTTVHDKISVLNAGADLYLPKPYEISDLIRWVEYFLKKN